MPTIDVSDETHDLLRGFAHTAEESDDAVLKRILDAARADREAALKAYEEAEQDVTSTN